MYATRMALLEIMPGGRCRRLLGGAVHAVANDGGVSQVYCRPFTYAGKPAFRWMPPETSVNCRNCIHKAEAEAQAVRLGWEEDD